MSNYFQVFNSHVSGSAAAADVATEDIWNNIKTGLLNTSEVCGTTASSYWRRETWWWNEHVEKAIAAKGKAFKAWKTSKGTRARALEILKSESVLPMTMTSSMIRQKKNMYISPATKTNDNWQSYNSF